MSFLPPQWQPSDTELKDRTVLITGAGNGIGRAVALACAKVGAEVLLLGRNEVGLEAVYDDILSAGGREAGIIPFDLNTTDPGRYEALAEQLTATGITLDGLVHNASVLGERRLLAQTSPASWQEVMQVNVSSTFLLTRALMPLLTHAAPSSIILTSSGVGRRGTYAVSKFATEGYMQVLADELKATSQIRVNSLNPGAVNTKMRRTAYPGEQPNTNPSPEALTAYWVYLLSDASQSLHGETLSAQD